MKADVHQKGATKLPLFMEGKNSAGLGVSTLAAKKTTKKNSTHQVWVSLSDLFSLLYRESKRDSQWERPCWMMLMCFFFCHFAFFMNPVRATVGISEEEHGGAAFGLGWQNRNGRHKECLHIWHTSNCLALAANSWGLAIWCVHL